MTRRCVAVAVCALLYARAGSAQKNFTLEQILNAPFNANLVAARNVNRIAWTSNQEGRRNLWVAGGPDFAARQLTSYPNDDGGELSDLKFSADGNSILYVRGEGKNSAGDYANPTSNPAGEQQTVWSISWNGGAPVKIDAGTSPVVSPQGQIAYGRGGELWLASLNSAEKPKQIVVRGKNHSADWSPDGTLLLFVSDRGDHSFIGIYDAKAQTVKFLAPSIDSDQDPVWSPDGKRVAFVRQPAVPRDTPEGYFIEPDRPHLWSIWVADVETGAAREVWHSGTGLQDSFPYMADDTGGGVIHWVADNIVFASEADGWQHLYAIRSSGGPPKLLTPGDCEVEEWSFPRIDGTTALFNSNCGDVDRRHLWRVDAIRGAVEPLTASQPHEGIEWSPVFLADQVHYAYIASGVRYPGRIMLGSIAQGSSNNSIGPEQSSDFPSNKLVTPQPITFRSADGLEIHGQLFLPKDLKAGEKRPALIFLHGGPMRQMLLGWHYMYYYANAYAMNQYLANRGYIVLAINYRSGIGYGRAFREAPHRAGRGASEYQDVVAAGKYLDGRADVDASHIGLWGGSYGGYLTALGLGRNSDLFAAGVDYHGVHDWPADNWEGKHIPPDLVKLAHESSPVSAVSTWKSPVLFIHGDDDRNVMFSQTVDLVARLRAQGVLIEQLVFPDDVHDFLLSGNWLKAYQATSDFFDHRFGASQK